MTKEERAKLLRQRLDVVRGYKLLPFKVVSRPDNSPTKRPFRNHIQICVGNQVKELPVEWAAKGDEVEGHGFKEGFRHRAHDLTRIAERLRRGWQR